MTTPIIDITSRDACTRLFKYRALGAERCRALDILANHRLHVSPAGSLNDPFECQAIVSFDAPQEQKLERAIRRIQIETPLISAEAARNAAPERVRQVEKHGRQQFDEMVQTKLGFVSFGRVYDNLLMWAHYADSHRGLVLEFDATKLSGQPCHYSSASFFGGAQRVQYTDTLPTINFYTDALDEQARKLLLTKSRHWDYEEEWRMVIMDRTQSPSHSFSPEFLTAVYLGCRTTEADCAAVQKCIQSRGVEVALFRANPSKSKYGLEFDQI
jgi:hypothetical protein